LFQNTDKRSGRYIYAGLASNCDRTGFNGMMKLTMASSLPHQLPAIRLNQGDKIFNFHAGSLAQPLLEAQSATRLTYMTRCRWQHSNPPKPLASAINKVHAKTANKKPEDQPELRPRHLVREVGANPRADEHGRGQYDGRLNIDVSVPVIFECRGEADGREQQCKRRSGRHVLRETGPVNKRRYDDDASADAEEARGDATENTDNHEYEP